MGICDLCGFDHLFHRGVFHSERYIVEYRVVEEDGFLVHIAYEAAEVLDP